MNLDALRRAVRECRLIDAWELYYPYPEVFLKEFHELLIEIRDSPSLILDEALQILIYAHEIPELDNILNDLVVKAWQRNPEALGEDYNFDFFTRWCHWIKRETVIRLCGPASRLKHRIKRLLEYGDFGHTLFKPDFTNARIVFNAMIDHHGLDINYVDPVTQSSLFFRLATCYATNKAALELAKRPEFVLPINEPGGLFQPMFQQTGTLTLYELAHLPAFQQPLLDKRGNSFHGMAMAIDVSMVINPNWLAVMEAPNLKLMDLVARYRKAGHFVSDIFRLNHSGELLKPQCDYGTGLFAMFLYRRDRAGISAILRASSQEHSNAALIQFASGEENTIYKGAITLAIPLLVRDGYYRYNNRLHRIKAIRFFEMMTQMPPELRDWLVRISVQLTCGKRPRGILSRYIELAYVCIQADQLIGDKIKQQ